MRDPTGDGELAGIMDATGFLGGAPSRWSVYWEVDDVDEALARAKNLGGTVTSGPDDTPYGILAGVAGPAGAGFKLRALKR